MDRPSIGSPRLERRSTGSSGPNIFSDENALLSVEQDGGQQGSVTEAEGDHSLLRRVGGRPLQRPIPPQQSLEGHIGPMSRNDASQRMTRQSTCSSRHSQSQSVVSLSDAHTPSTNRRSTISSSGSPRAQSPYQGATVSSHPYAMYPQATTVTRTSSVATTSTLRRPERSYSGPHGPTQPYAMYPQNTVSENGPDPFNDAAHVLGPVYHPGSHSGNPSYQRRLGPEREDADDLIGPDGYTEQLPPYTRYVNDIPPKPVPEATDGFPLPTRDQQPATTTQERPGEDLHRGSHSTDDPISISPARVQIPRQNPPSDGSTSANSTMALDVEPKGEKRNFKERVRSRVKRRVCWGVMPCWFLAVIFVIFFFAVLIGGILGSLLTQRRSAHKGLNVSQAEVSASSSVYMSNPSSMIK